MSVEHWETYYRGGAIATCPMGPEATYTLELRELWLGFFAALPDGARILDIGTGNGAIPLLAREAATAAGRHFEIHGADLAAIDPPRHVPDGVSRFAGIVFHPGMPTERLGFESGSLDAVSGQYALEYAEPRPALGEVARVLGHGGRALFVLHHGDSTLVQNARESLAHGALVLEDTRILRRLRRCAAAERESPAAAQGARRELLEAAAALQRTATASATPHVLRVVLDGVDKLLGLRGRLSPAAFEREVDRFERDVRAGVRRLQDLVGHALGEQQVRALATAARELGLECDPPAPQVHGGSNLVGWRLALAKP